jgi:hypothetical protein
MRAIGNFNDRSIYFPRNSALRIANNTSLQSADFTLEFIIKKDTDYSGDEYFLSHNHYVSTSDNGGFAVRLINKTTITFYTRNGSGASAANTSITIPDVSQQHVQVSISYTNSTGTIRFYINGVFYSSLSRTILTNTKAPFFIGGYNYTPDVTNTISGYRYDGLLTYVRYWNYIRTDNQIASNWMTHIDQAEGLVLSVRGGNLTSTQAIDMSGYNNHGTLVGTPVQSKDSPFNKMLTTGEAKLITYAGGGYFSLPNASEYHLVGRDTTIYTESLVPSAVSYLIGYRGTNNTGYGISLDPSTNTVSFAVFGSAVVSFSVPLTIGSRIKIAFLLTDRARSIKLYINGVYIGENTTATYTGHSSALYLGALANSSGVYSASYNTEIYNIIMLPRLATLDEIANMDSAVSKLLWIKGETLIGTVPTKIGNAVRQEKTKLLLSQPKTPYALSFDGVSSSAYFSEIADVWKRQTDFSFSMWVTFRGTGATDVIFSTRTTVNNVRMGLNIYRESNNRISFYMGRGSTFATPMLSSSATPNIPLNKVTHICFTILNGTLKYYVDGNMVFSTYSSLILEYISDGIRHIGLGALSSNPSTFNGDVNYVKGFDKALTDDEVHKDAASIPLSSMKSLLVYNGLSLRDEINEYKGVLYGNAGRIESTAPVGQRSSLDFNGVNGYGKISSLIGESPLGTNAHTLEAWVKPLTLNNDYNYIIAIGNGSTAIGNQTSMGIRGNGNVFQSAYSSPIINFNYTVPKYVWVHLAIVHENGISKLYVNGVFREQIAVQFNVAGTKVNIASHTRDLSYNDSLISCLRVWRKGLTETEIKQYMHSYASPTNPDLIEEWRIQEGVGATLYGTKGNHVPLYGDNTWQTPTVANWVNKAARFSGGLSNNNAINYMKATSSLAPYLKANATIVLAVKPISTIGGGAANENVVLYQPNNRASGIAGISIHFQSSKFTVRVTDADGVVREVTMNGSITLGQWYTIHFVIEPKLVSLYLNGVFNKSTITSTEHILDIHPTQHLRLGAMEIGYVSTYNSSSNVEIDDLQIWNISMSASDIQANMNRVLDRHPNLVGYWRMDKISSDYLIYDSSGCGNHITAVGYSTPESVLVESDNPNLIYNAPIN